MEKRAAARKVLILMLISLAVRILAATQLELGNDEAYYALYARFPAWSYFDHPAMLGWAVRVLNFGGVPHTAWALRLPALVFGTANIYLAFLLGARLKNPLCGYYAALLYASSLYVTIIAGVFILPDTPQSFFWMLGLVALAGPRRRWLLFGLFAGLAVLSKYHGVFLWAGAGLYVLIQERKELRNPYLYLGAAVSLACLFPILYWNGTHGWASFVYQGNRHLASDVPLIHWDNLLQEMLGEFFYNSLPVVVLIITALWAYRRRPYLPRKTFVLLLCMSLPLILFVWGLSTRRETLPHWTGPAYLALMILPAAWLTERRATPAIAVCLGFTALVIGAGILDVRTGFLDIGKQPPRVSGDLHKDDFTLDLYGWDQIGRGTDSLLRTLVARDSLDPDYQFLQVNWFNGAHVDFYVAEPLGKQTLVLGPLRDIHQFYWVNQARDWSKTHDYCFVTNSREYQGIDRLPPVFRAAFHRTDTLRIYRGGRLAEAAFVTAFRDIPVDSVRSLICQMR